MKKKTKKVISTAERIRVARLLRYIAKHSASESALLYGNKASFYVLTRPLLKKIKQLFDLSEDEMKKILK